MRDFKEYKKDFNKTNVRHGEKIFRKQLKALEGENVVIDGNPCRCLVINDENIYNEKKEFRTLCMDKDEKCEHGSYVFYDNEYYLVVTDIDNHYYYKSCKIRKCNQILKWKQGEEIHEFYCIVANDSYGVKIMSDNDYIRSQNIKAQITVQSNDYTKKIVADMRFMFNHSEFDIYNIVDINTSIVNGIIILTAEKSVYQIEDDLINNLAFCGVVNSKNKEELPDEFEIVGKDILKQLEVSEYILNPFYEKCTFYIDEFQSNNIATIIESNNKMCKVEGKKNISKNYFTLYAKDENGKTLSKKNIQVER